VTIGTKGKTRDLGPLLKTVRNCNCNTLLMEKESLIYGILTTLIERVMNPPDGKIVSAYA